MIPYNPNANAVLPPGVVLNRLNVSPGGALKRCRPYGPNRWDDCLDEEYREWMNLLASGGLKNCCPKGRRKYTSPPWIHMPAEGRRFKPIGVQPLTAFQVPGPAFNGLDTIVMQERVPLGYDGVITEIVCNFTGTGFVEGSGDITWRLAADFQIDAAGITQGRFLRDQGNLTVSVGSLQFPQAVSHGGLRVYSWDLVSFYCAISPGAAIANGNIICSVSGWFWPR